MDAASTPQRTSANGSPAGALTDTREAPVTRSGTLPIIEIFHSPQGEGTRMGEPATFIRLAGCNLRCSWCDTPYSWNREGVAAATATTGAEIAAQVRERAVVVTGGEPMLHARRLPDLVGALRAAGVGHVTVETNATIEAGALAGQVDLWSLSPKLPGSGEAADPGIVRWYVEHLSDKVQLKFVIADVAADWQAMWQLLEDVGDAVSGLPILVQPDGLREDYEVALRELCEQVMADKGTFAGRARRSLVRVLPQSHRVAWGPRARGI